MRLKSQISGQFVLNACGALLAVLGLLVMYGWYINNPLLIQITPSFVPMQFNTALGFFLSGIMLLFLGFKKEKWAVIPALILILGTALTLYEYLFDVTLPHFDEFFITADILTKSPYPGRMAPSTALCFLLTGLSVAIPKTFIFLRTGMVSAIWVISILALLSYTAGIEEIYGIGILTRMALHTVIGFFIIGVALSLFIRCLYIEEGFTLWKASPVIILTMGLIFSLFSFYSTQELIERQNHQYFESLVSDSENGLYRRFVVYRQSLLSGLGLFRSSQHVTRSEWRTYVKALEIDQYLPGINGIGYIDYVQEKDLDRYLEAVRQDNAPDFQNYPETSFADKFIIRYIEPVERNREALGLDIGFEANRREAADRARKTGRASLSRIIGLVQDNQKRPGFLLLIPHYGEGAEKGDFKGWVYAPFIGEYFLQDISDFSKNQIDFAVYDGLSMDENNLIYAGSSFQEDKKQKHAATSVIDIAGRKWTIQWQTTDNFVPRYSNRQSFFVLALGLIATLFITITLRQLVNRRALVDSEVLKRTEELNKTRKRLRLIMDSIPDLVFVKDEDFRIVDANPAFLELYAPEVRDKVLGTTTVEKFPEEEAFMFLEADRKALEEGTSEYQEKITDFRGQQRMLMTKKVAFEDWDGKHYIIAVARDITELHKAQKMLRESEERLKLALQTSEIGLWDWDYQHDNLYFNDQFFTMLGYEAYEKTGSLKTVEELVHPEDFGPAIEILNEHIEGERELFDTIVRMKRASGEWAWIAVQGKVLSWDDKGRPLRLIGTHVDITAFKRSQEEAEKAREEAKKASLLKSEFVANMSHELRTPLNGIIGVTELLDKTGLTDKQASYVDIIQSSGNRLLSLVNDVLDFSKIEAGMVELKLEPTRLRELVEETVKIHALQAVQKNIELGVGYDPEIPECLMVDGLRIQQILTNLLSNAIKFTDNGRVLLGVHLKRKTKRTVKVRFKIIDQGVGIPKDKIKDIFQKFLQLDQTTAKQHVGTGLGLAITKDLVELMGGKIQVDSTPGEGSVFWFDLTFKICTDKALPQKAKKETVEKSSRTKTTKENEKKIRGKSKKAKTDILLVEDEEVNRIVAKGLLEQIGYDVDVAKNGNEAVDKIKAGGQYDIVFMDCMMPGMDGYEATGLIREYERENNLPPVFIVAMTAKAMEDTAQKCQDAGMNDYFPKPIRQKLLQEKIDLWLSGKGQ